MGRIPNSIYFSHLRYFSSLLLHKVNERKKEKALLLDKSVDRDQRKVGVHITWSLPHEVKGRLNRFFSDFFLLLNLYVYVYVLQIMLREILTYVYWMLVNTHALSDNFLKLFSRLHSNQLIRDSLLSAMCVSRKFMNKCVNSWRLVSSFMSCFCHSHVWTPSDVRQRLSPRIHFINIDKDFLRIQDESVRKRIERQEESLQRKGRRFLSRQQTKAFLFLW